MVILSLKITTKSSLYIGGMPQGFEIGGIDMATVTRDSKPYIPASSFKGALREICKDYECPEITALYSKYTGSDQKIPKHLFVFGVPGRSDTPKLLFNDFICETDKNEMYGDYFSVDMKNSIDEADGQLFSNPRSYRVAKAGLTFGGDILFRPGGFGIAEQDLIKKYIKNMCEKFNGGIYRLGNSKSRGYGHIAVAEDDEKAELKS